MVAPKLAFQKEGYSLLPVCHISTSFMTFQKAQRKRINCNMAKEVWPPDSPRQARMDTYTHRCTHHPNSPWSSCQLFFSQPTTNSQNPKLLRQTVFSDLKKGYAKRNRITAKTSWVQATRMRLCNITKGTGFMLILEYSGVPITTSTAGTSLGLRVHGRGDLRSSLNVTESYFPILIK
jgi:hypothetical protein